MFNSKKSAQSLEQKIDLSKEEFELENKAQQTIKNIAPTKVEEIANGKGNVFSGINRLKKWAIENQFEEKTKAYLETMTDGVAEFVEGIIKEYK